MNHLKKILFGLAAVVTLALVGAGTASATICGVTPTASAPTIRAEGTIEKVGTVTLDCTAAANTIAAPDVVPSNITLAFTPTATKVTAGSAGQCTSNPTAPNNTSTFACPVLSSWTTLACAQSNGGVGCVPVAFGAAPVATISGNVINFNFTPTGGAQAFAITGVRINASSAGLPSGGTVTAGVARGGAFIAKSDTVVEAFVIALLNVGTGFTNAAPLAIAACGPAVATPLGTPATIAGNPDVTALNSIKVSLIEGFEGAFTTTAFSDQLTPATAGLQGIRFRINLTGVPAGLSVYAPEVVSVGSAATTGGVSGGTALVAPPTPANTTVISLVTGAAADGSGGSVVAGVANQFDLVAAVGGTVSIVYEVTAKSASLGLEAVALNIALTGGSGVGVGAISGAVSPAPVGPPTTSASIPQFGGGKASVVANVALCASYLLYPWLVTTNDGNYDTGLTVSNTTADPSIIGSTGQTGDVTLYLFPSDGSAAITQALGTGVKPGQTVTFVMSSLKKAFQGYGIAVCNFTLGHGFAFIDNPIAGQNGFAEGYLAISLTNPRIGSTVPTESRGH